MNSVTRVQFLVVFSEFFLPLSICEQQQFEWSGDGSIERVLGSSIWPRLIH